MLSRLISKDFLARVWARANEDEIFDRAAQLSYYFLLALFPLLLFLITLFGYFDGAGSRLRDKLISYLNSVIPGSALELVVATINEVTAARGGGKLSFGLLAALWAASSGMNAIGQSLNAAYDVRETRPWWKIRLVSIALTIALSTLIISALLIVLYGGRLGHFFAALIYEGDAFIVAWRILQWPLALTFVFVTFSLIYQFAPNLAAKRRGRRLPASDYRRRWLSPGVLVAVTLWLLVSLGFRLYLHFFNSYSATYGSLGALIVLMLWFYLTGAAILLGGEINCELERVEKQHKDSA
ncbi:MAG TPA: YihY/virulence factor BrkB family protein [Pyrinomonadaceae bacterium]|nr:YihY/virulence factor BrkB family protein [Pyrinomonadaceae bacterium]